MGSDGVDQWGDGEQKALNTTCNERKYIAENGDNRQRNRCDDEERRRRETEGKLQLVTTVAWLAEEKGGQPELSAGADP